MDAMVRPRIDRLLRPRSVAIVGVSGEHGHPGGSALNNLVRCNFAGDIHLVRNIGADVAEFIIAFRNERP